MIFQGGSGFRELKLHITVWFFWLCSCCHIRELENMEIDKEEIINAIDAYFALCKSIVTENSSDYKKLTLYFSSARSNLVKYEGFVQLPSWIKNSISPSIIKSHIDLKVEGGNGSWERRRKYLSLEREKIIEALDIKMQKSYPLDSSTSMDKGFTSPMIEAFKAAGGGDGAIPIRSSSSIISSNALHYEEERLGMTNAGSAKPQMKKRVFIVHGHDDHLKNHVYVFLNQEGYTPVILHEQVNKGATIIEKLEENIDTVSFAVVLYTPCDEGKALADNGLQPRARQNVVFEHGYLICKLGRSKVAALKSDGVEIPSDLSGLITIPTNNWKYDLLKEIKEAIG